MFSGIVTGIAHYLSGHVQAQVTPMIGMGGEHRAAQWIDLPLLAIDPKTTSIELEEDDRS